MTTKMRIWTAAMSLGALMIICAPNAWSQPARPSASAQMTLWQAIEAVMPKQVQFTREGVENGLGVRLTISIDEPDDSWFKGEKSLANGVHIKDIDLRAIGASKSGFLVLWLDSNGTCISVDQVRTHYKNLGEPESAWPQFAEGTPASEMGPAEIGYWSDQPWGRLAFSFNAPKLECLGAVAYHIRE